ncbi:MAG: hypothetical protein CM15mP83_2360 [Flavobacteriaceae bacterium]|nr:MAG: hypothetical protein CM15mP83_2360 [Flavobacteriaceae bacterium]
MYCYELWWCAYLYKRCVLRLKSIFQWDEIFYAAFAINVFWSKIYSVDYSSQADVKVYVVDYESQCDLKVYKVDYSSQTDGNEGFWYFVDYASKADKKVYFVEYESQSDLKIYFVKYKLQAGWKNKSKNIYFIKPLAYHHQYPSRILDCGNHPLFFFVSFAKNFIPLLFSLVF